jgi:hypothetical protein
MLLDFQVSHSQTSSEGDTNLSSVHSSIVDSLAAGFKLALKTGDVGQWKSGSSMGKA